MTSKIKDNELLDLSEKIMAKVKVIEPNLLITKSDLNRVKNKTLKSLKPSFSKKEYEKAFIDKTLALNRKLILVMEKLRTISPKLIYTTVDRYSKSSFAQIFNEADMTSLAETTILKVINRYKKGVINPKGLSSYYRRSFINQTLKLYESHAKTDIRGGIQTVGSDEAMALAISKNKYNPEGQYIVENVLDLAFKYLKKSDEEYNKNIQQYNESSIVKQKYFDILNLLFKGHTAEEVCKEVNIIMPEFLRQKRLACEFLKKKLPVSFEEIQEDFSHQEDLRIHAQDVDKRSIKDSEIEQYKVQNFFYIQEKYSDDQPLIQLCSRLTISDRKNNFVEISKKMKLPTAKILVLEEKTLTKKDQKENLKKILLKKIKDPEFESFLEKESVLFLNDFKEKLRGFKNNKKTKSVA